LTKKLDFWMAVFEMANQIQNIDISVFIGY